MLSPLQQKALAKPQTIGVTSPAWRAGEPIPREFSGHGEDVSPPLAWTGAPERTRAFAIVVDDPDAPRGTWTHWTVWNLPGDTRSLERGADVRGMGAIEGTTSARSAGYHGPAPPSGTHRYFFRVFALDDEIGLPLNAAVDEVWSALAQHTLAWGELMGTFSA